MLKQAEIKLDPSKFQLLKLVSLEPVIAFNDPREYWIDVIRLIPLGDSLELSVADEQKFEQAGFWYIHHLEQLTQTEIERRTGLSSTTLNSIGNRLHKMGRSFHPTNTLTLEEQVEIARNTYRYEIDQLQAALNNESPEAGVFLAKLAEIRVIDDLPEDLYRKAIQLGSGQAANDLAAMTLRSKTHDPEEFQKYEGLFRLAESRGIPQATRNLEILNDIVSAKRSKIAPEKTSSTNSVPKRLFVGLFLLIISGVTVSLLTQNHNSKTSKETEWETVTKPITLEDKLLGGWESTRNHDLLIIFSEDKRILIAKPNNKVLNGVFHTGDDLCFTKNANGTKADTGNLWIAIEDQRCCLKSYFIGEKLVLDVIFGEPAYMPSSFCRNDVVKRIPENSKDPLHLFRK